MAILLEAATGKATMDESELRSLRAFRRAALQVRNASVIASNATVQMEAATTTEGVQVQFQLLSTEPFRSLAITLRLVYMESEPAHFYRVCNILHRNAIAEIQRRVADCRARYQSALESQYIRFELHGKFEGRVAGPRDVLEAWLYGLAFHQDLKKEEIAEELGKYMGGIAFLRHEFSRGNYDWNDAWHGPENLLETGPHSVPTRPWP